MTVFDLSGLESKSKELTELTLVSGFWERENARDISRELASAQERLAEWSKIENELEELETLVEILSETEDRELVSEFYKRADELTKFVEARQIYVLLDEEYDEADAIVTVHAGAGGLDSQD